jgi:hypothetical protein
MILNKIADAKADFSHWKEMRRGYLTSSEVFGWREVDVPPWYSEDNNKLTVLAGKRGAEKEFDQYAETSMAHGTYDEQHIQEKFGYIVGCLVKPDNGLYTNPRWSHIAASIDGFGQPWDMLPDTMKKVVGDGGPPPEVHPELCQDRGLAHYLRDYIDVTGSMFITEVKKSTSSKFQRMVPEYYVPQVKTQLSILELPYAIIMADTFMRHPEQKWRNVWDFRAYVIERDPAWDLVLDEENENFKTALDVL